jgi:hypothetical protein
MARMLIPSVISVNTFTALSRPVLNSTGRKRGEPYALGVTRLIAHLREVGAALERIAEVS